MDQTALHQANLSRLTPRQRECLRYVYQRRTTKEIAALTGLQPGTVDTYIAEAVTALGARNRRHAAEMLHEAESPPANVDKIPTESAGDGGQPTPGKLEPEETGVEAEPDKPIAPVGRTEPQQWAAILPFRQRGAIGNDLGPVARLVTIVGFAIALSVGFGMLAVGMRVVSDLAAGFR